MFKNLLLFALAALAFSCSTKKQTHRTDIHIDNSIIPQVDSQIARFNKKSNANISFVVYNDDKPKITNDVGEAALAFNMLIDNSLAIDCINGVDDGFGFSLVITHDTSFVKLKVLSKNDSTLFKLASSDALQPELLVNAKTSRVTLAELPKFTPGEIIQGKVELESEPFLEVSNGSERTLRFNLTAYFKSEPAPVVNNQYKTLVK